MISLPGSSFATDTITLEKKPSNDSSVPGLSISSNPAAVNVLTGTGIAQSYIEKKLGIKNNHGIRVGGFLSGDANYLFSGGIPNPEKLTFNGLFLLGVSVEMEKLIGWRGGLFDVEFLQFNGQKTNAQAATIQGYNSLPGAPPLNRFEIYKLWFRQEFLNKKLYVRVGKTVPSMDFDNVSKPIPLDKEQLFIPAVSGLIYTPLFVNSSMLGVMPGYYNSAYGITINVVPTRKWYLSYGAYDGSLAQGIQTGLTGPNFKGAYFHIAETGFNWLLGKNNMPGDFGVGLWHQTGLIQTNPTLTEHGASGYYIFGTQRLWYRNPSINNSGISGFYQYGKTNSSVLNMTQYVGAGLTAFALIPHRENDSMGVGAALSWLNQKSFNQATELMYQAYYQMQILTNIYVEPALTYIPTPGISPHTGAAWAGTLRAIILF
jgi:porin